MTQRTSRGRPPELKRSPSSEGGPFKTLHVTAATAIRDEGIRWPLAVDAAEQLREASRWIDASNVVLGAALESGAIVELCDAAAHALDVNRRVRRLLAASVVGEVSV